VSEDVFNEIGDDLELTYRLDGADRRLGEFTGVVDLSEESRTYYSWRVVSMDEESGVELTAESGAVHTYSVEYFSDQLQAGRYRPAISTESGVQVAAVDGEPVTADDERAQPAESSPAVDEPSEEESPVEPSGGTADAIDSPARTDESRGTVLDDADSPAGIASEQATSDRVSADDHTGSNEQTTDADADAGERPDADESAELGEPAATGELADVDRSEPPDEPAAAGETSDTADESAANAESDPGRDEVERLRTIVTDTTRHRFVRENAIRELGDHGEQGAGVLERIVDDESLTAEERALASVVLRDVRAETD
jgi:hypothetical protein